MSTSKALTIPVPLRTGRERREAERIPAAMPVSVDGVEATTADLSSTGLSFHSEQDHAPGARLEVVIEYLLDGHQYPLCCEAVVMRSEPAPDGYRIGAKLLLPPPGEIAVTGNEALAPLAVRKLRSID